MPETQCLPTEESESGWYNKQIHVKPLLMQYILVFVCLERPSLWTIPNSPRFNKPL